MKAKTIAKPLKNPINLSKSPVRFTPTGSIEPVAQRGRAHPGVEGRLAGEARMTRNPPHAGEMHPDGDELLYLVEGAVDVILDEEAGERCLSLQPGQAPHTSRSAEYRCSADCLETTNWLGTSTSPPGFATATRRIREVKITVSQSISETHDLTGKPYST